MKQGKPVRRKRPAGAENYDSVMRHHRAAWRVERVGWAVIAMVLVAALLGAFGDGALSRAQAGSSAALLVEYDRLLRSSAPTMYAFRAHPATAASGIVHLRVDQSLVDRMELESIMPAPEHQAAGPGYTEFSFRASAGDSPLRIDFRFRPATFGPQAGRVSVAGSHSVLIDQFVFP